MARASAPTQYGKPVWTGRELLLVRWEGPKWIKAYDPKTDRWRDIAWSGTEPEAREDPFVGWVDGKLFLYGGTVSTGDGGFARVKTGGLLDIGSGAWTPTSTDSAPDLAHAIDVDAHVFFNGGLALVLSIDDIGQAFAAAYDSASQRWVASLDSLSAPKVYGCRGAVQQGADVICSGPSSLYRHGINPLGLTALPPPPQAFFSGDGFERHYLTWIGDRLFAWGGDPNIGLNPRYRGAFFDKVAEAWTSVEGGPGARFSPAIGNVSGKVVLWGGIGFHPSEPRNEEVRDDGAVWDPETQSWSEMTCDGAPPIDTRYAVSISTGAALIVFNGREGARFEL